MYKFLILFCAIVIMGCQSNTNKTPATENKKVKERPSNEELTNELFDRMSGYFNSAKQAQADTNYYNIILKMVPIWENTHRGNWLYVEQALKAAERKPYRQRVYKVFMENDRFVSEVYTIPNEDRFVYSYKNTDAFRNLHPDSLVLREGCAVILDYVDGDFKGATHPTDCKSTLRGASYAVSEVEVYKDKIISWDRGFDDKGAHVWGAENGGYVFDKVAGFIDK